MLLYIYITVWIAPKVCQGQPPTMYSGLPISSKSIHFRRSYSQIREHRFLPLRVILKKALRAYNKFGQVCLIWRTQTAAHTGTVRRKAPGVVCRPLPWIPPCAGCIADFGDNHGPEYLLNCIVTHAMGTYHPQHIQVLGTYAGDAMNMLWVVTPTSD